MFTTLNFYKDREKIKHRAKKKKVKMNLYRRKQMISIFLKNFNHTNFK